MMRSKNFVEPYFNQCINRYDGYDFVGWEKTMLDDCMAEGSYLTARAAFEQSQTNESAYITYRNAPKIANEWTGYINLNFEVIAYAPERQSVTIDTVDAIGIASKNIDLVSYEQDLDILQAEMQASMNLKRSHVFKNYLGQDRRNYFYQAALVPALRNTSVLLDSIDNPSNGGDTNYGSFMDYLVEWGHPSLEGANWERDWGTREKLELNSVKLEEQIWRHAALRGAHVEKLYCNVRIDGTIRAFDRPILNSVKLGSRQVETSVKLRLK